MDKKELEENKRKDNKNTTVANSKKSKTQKNRFEGVIEKMEIEAKKANEISKEKKEEQKDKAIEKNKTELVVKDKQINKEELEKIEQEINKQKEVPKEIMNKIYLRVFENIMYAIFILLYFILVCIGSKTIPKEVYVVDLKVFSVFSIAATIWMIEYAYKKDSGRHAMHSIELLIVAVITLFMPYMYIVNNNKFIGILSSIALLIAIYYVGKSIIDYVKRKKRALKKTSDVRKIAK